MKTVVLGFQLVSDDVLWHTPTQVLKQKSRTAVIWERECVETHTVFPIEDRSALTAALNPSAFDGTTINISLFRWAIRPPGQDIRIQARKERVSLTPEIKMGVSLARSLVTIQALATWAFEVVPSGMPLRGPDRSLDISLLVVSIKTTGSDGSESLAMGLSGLLG